MNKVIHLFQDVDMRMQHNGLTIHAAKKKVDLNELKSGQHIVFLNSKMNRFKIFSPGGILTYQYQSKGRFDIQAFSKVAQAFSEDGQLNFDKALKESLIERLSKRHVTKK